MDNILQCLKDNGYGELPEELGQEALDNYFDMRQGKAESILDYISHEEILTVALKKDTAIDLDEKIRGYWLMRTSNLTQTQLAQVKRAISQTIVAKKREEVRDDLREAGDRARDRPGGYAEGRARSTGKSIEELKKVTSCNRSARSRKKRSPSEKGKGKSRRFRREKSDGKGRGGSSNYPIVEVYNDCSKTQTSRMKVPPGYAVLDFGVAKSLCGAKLVALMAQTCAREVKRVGDKRDTEVIDESCHSSDCQFIHETSCSWVD